MPAVASQEEGLPTAPLTEPHLGPTGSPLSTLTPERDTVPTSSHAQPPMAVTNTLPISVDLPILNIFLWNRTLGGLLFLQIGRAHV